ncbi:MAG: hypothetical protein K0R43_2663 [Pseudoduganella sp.]|jgi:hypothetical protein|nr:hypothetical protein [Pseudoduganella sp.]
MRNLVPAVLAAFPLVALAAPAHSLTGLDSPCPETAARYAIASKPMTITRPGLAPLTIDVPEFGTKGHPPLFAVLMSLDLYLAPQTEQLPEGAEVFEVMHAMPMPDNTFRSAYMRCDASEVWVSKRGGFIDQTTLHGPFNVAQLMSARGDAAPQFP